MSEVNVCPQWVYSPEIPKEFKGMKRQEMIFKLMDEGWDQDCIVKFIQYKFGKTGRKGYNYYQALKKKYKDKKQLEQIQAKNDELDKETKPSKQELEALKIEIPKEEEAPAEEELEETPEEIGLETVEELEAPIEPDDIADLYGATLEFYLRIQGVDIDLNEIIPEHRIRRSGKYLYNLMKRHGLLNNTKVMDAIQVMGIAQDIILLQQAIEEHKKKREIPISTTIKPIETQTKTTETEEDTGEDLTEDERERLRKKVKKVWDKIS